MNDPPSIGDPRLPPQFGGSWRAFCEQWHPAGSLGCTPEEIARGLSALVRLWPAKAAEFVETRVSGHGVAFTPRAIDLGLMLLDCEGAPNFARQLERLRTGERAPYSS